MTAYCEEHVRSGYIDVVTRTELIEVKRARQWKHALGQVLAYHFDHADKLVKRKRIHLFGSSRVLKRAIRLATPVCNANGVRITSERVQLPDEVLMSQVEEPEPDLHTGQNNTVLQEIVSWDQVALGDKIRRAPGSGNPCIVDMFVHILGFTSFAHARTAWGRVKKKLQDHREYTNNVAIQTAEGNTTHIDVLTDFGGIKYLLQYASTKFASDARLAGLAALERQAAARAVRGAHRAGAAGAAAQAVRRGCESIR